MGLRNFDSNFMQCWGVSPEIFAFIALFWILVIGIVLGFHAMDNPFGGMLAIVITLGTCLLVRFFGWQVLAIPAGGLILLSGAMMFCRR